MGKTFKDGGDAWGKRKHPSKNKKRKKKHAAPKNRERRSGDWFEEASFEKFKK